MEFSRNSLNRQRLLAAVFVLIAFFFIALERHSPISQCINQARPWPFWIRTNTSSAHLGVYDPVNERLTVIRMPETLKLDDGRSLARARRDAARDSSAPRDVEVLLERTLSNLCPVPISWEEAGRISLALPETDAGDDVEIYLASALKNQAHSPRALMTLARRAASAALKNDRAPLDALLLAFELHHVAPKNLAPALLPDEAHIGDFLPRVFRTDPSSIDPRPIVAEVLNGTNHQGLASEAAKMLRSQGVDVFSLGSTSKPRMTTVAFDRTGDFERAARVRAALRCPTAAAATRIDPSAGVDVSVELGEDCAEDFIQSAKRF